MSAQNYKNNCYFKRIKYFISSPPRHVSVKFYHYQVIRRQYKIDYNIMVFMLLIWILLPVNADSVAETIEIPGQFLSIGGYIFKLGVFSHLRFSSVLFYVKTRCWWPSICRRRMLWWRSKTQDVIQTLRHFSGPTTIT